MKVNELLEDFKAKKIVDTKINPTAVSDYLKSAIEVKTYLPFSVKKAIVQKVVDANVNIVDGYKVVDSISQFLGFVTAMLIAYTSLEIEDPYEAYDMLSESGLLQPIIECFRSEYDACDVLLKLALGDEMQTNSIQAIIAQFLDDISKKISDIVGDFNLKDLIKEEDLAKLSGFLDKYNK